MKLWRALPLLAGLGLLALQARGDAPITQYESFDKSQSFILDRKTHLRWQRFVDANNPAQTMSEGVTACEKLTGYRLPTVKELLTLVDEEPHEEFDPSSGKNTLRYIDRNAFAGTPTSNTYITLSDDAGKPWTVDFATGTAQQLTSASGSFYVRCVKAE